jgi:hypothetical protein
MNSDDFARCFQNTSGHSRIFRPSGHWSGLPAMHSGASEGTHLRNRTGCPEGLQKFWIGHADESLSDLYDKIKEDVAFRREWAD